MKNIIIIINLIFLVSCSSNSIKKQKLIVPKDFLGDIFIFYGQKFDKGESQKKGSTVSFYVPEDGVIFTHYNTADIMTIEEYFYNGKEIKYPRNLVHDTISIIMSNINGIGNPFYIRCSQYTVGNSKDIKYKNYKSSEFISGIYLKYADSLGNPKLKINKN